MNTERYHLDRLCVGIHVTVIHLKYTTVLHHCNSHCTLNFEILWWCRQLMVLIWWCWSPWWCSSGIEWYVVKCLMIHFHFAPPPPHQLEWSTPRRKTPLNPSTDISTSCIYYSYIGLLPFMVSDGDGGDLGSSLHPSPSIF